MHISSWFSGWGGRRVARGLDPVGSTSNVGSRVSSTIDVIYFLAYKCGCVRPSWIACPDLWKFWPNKPLGSYFPKHNWWLRWGSHSCDSPIGWFQLFERFPTVLTIISSPVNFFSVRLKTWFFIQAWSFLFFIICFCICGFFSTQSRIHTVSVKFGRVYVGFLWHGRVCMLVSKLLKGVFLGGNFEIFGF